MRRLLTAIFLVLLLASGANGVPIGTHTGANPSFDSVNFNVYTFATLPTTTSFPFLSSVGAPGTEIKCLDCAAATPTAQGVSLATPVTCVWTGGVWGCGEGIFNPQGFGASGSGAEGTCTVTSGSANLTACVGVDSFGAGQGIVVKNSGPAVALSVPQTLSVTPSCTGGGCVPTGATSYTYAVAAVDANGGESIATAPVTIANGVANLTKGTAPGGASLTLYNDLAWAAPASGTPVGYIVYQQFVGGTWAPIMLTTSANFKDYGSLPQRYGFAASPPGAAVPGDTVGKILSATPTTILLTSAGVVGTSGVGVVVQHDDTAAIQATDDAMCLVGGGVLKFPAGTYNFHMPTTAIDFTVPAFHHSCDNSAWTSDGEGSVNLVEVAASYKDAPWVNLTQDLLVAPTNFQTNALSYGWFCPWFVGVCNLPSYTIADSGSPPYQPGQMSIALATPTDAGNFAPGDDVVIGTGEGGSTNPTPVEANQVMMADATSGVVWFRWPLLAAYQQECYNVGTSGRTSSDCSGGKTQRPFLLVKATGATLHNFTMSNLVWNNFSNVHSVIEAAQVVHLNVHHNMVHGGLGFTFTGRGRWSLYSDNIIDLDGQTSDIAHTLLQGQILAGCDQGCGNYIFSHNIATSTSSALINSLAGQNAVFDSNSFIMGLPSLQNTGSPEAFFGSQSRCTDIHITNNSLVYQGSFATLGLADVVVHNDGACDGIVANNRIVLNTYPLAGHAITTAISLFGDNYIARANVIRSEHGASPLVASVLTTGRVDSDSHVLAATMSIPASNTNVALAMTLGALPAQSYIDDIQIAVPVTAPNGTAVQQVSVGVAGNHSLFALPVGVGATGVKTVFPGTGFGQQSTADQVAQFYYLADTTAPTQGKITVSLKYHMNQNSAAGSGSYQIIN